MPTQNSKVNSKPITLGEKLNPTKYLHEGWRNDKNPPYFTQQGTRQASLLINLPSGEDIYFIAEVSALSPCQETYPSRLNIKINDTHVGEWSLSSTTVFDKLIIIPASCINLQTATKVSFELDSAPSSAGNNEKISVCPGLSLHSITVNNKLDAYLSELQTGYNWVCSVRDNLIETTKQVLNFINNIPDSLPLIHEKIKGILTNPYVLANHQIPLLFDSQYFELNYDELKEGNIHNAIRKWVKKLNELNDAIVDIGNYATRHKKSKLYDSNQLTPHIPRYKYSTKIETLRTKNETLNNLEILARKNTISSVPSTLYLDITNACNFRCKMCYQSKSHFLQTNLINKHMLAILQMLPYLKKITIAGLGEPLMSRNLELLVLESKKLHCQTCLITNGSRIHKHLKTLKNFTTVSISFDGATAETFETLRHRSKFKQVTNNIKMLRESAPELKIAFSFVVSRINIDEIYATTKLAGNLGVNEINMTPMEHMPALELKASDQNLFNNELDKAEALAQQVGVTINSSIIPASFSPDNDSPRNKIELLNYVKSLPIRKERSYNIDTITQNFLKQEFHYYPPPVVFMKDELPNLSQEDVTASFPDKQTEIKHPVVLDLDEEIETINARIAELTTEIKEKPSHLFSLPHCLDPWKLNYVKSNGRSRLCCHADIYTGNLGDEGFKKSVNSTECCTIRQSMDDIKKVLPECKRCQAADRFMGIESMRNTCNQFGIRIN